jgi:hypothetical protein
MHLSCPSQAYVLRKSGLLIIHVFIIESSIAQTFWNGPSIGNNCHCFICFTITVAIVALNWRLFCSPANIWQCLETFLAVTTQAGGTFVIS